MAINTTTRQTTAFTSGNNFAFAFKVYEVGDVKVIRITTSTGAEEVLTITTHYTVTLNDDQNANPGGTVTLVNSGNPVNLGSGFNIVITSKVTPLQQTEITNQGGFFPEVINDVLDKAAILDQQQQAILDKTIRFPLTQTVGGLEITENAANRAGKVVQFDGSGDLAILGTVDGRDVSADGAKLDTIETNAKDDQTAAEIRALVESASDSNVFTDADHSKLNAIEAGATGDLNASEVKALYEGNSNTNVFTDAQVSKLNGIEAGATGDQSASEIRTLVESASNSNVFTDDDHTKLNNIEANATADQTASEIRGLVESASNSNVFTDDDHSKLNAIEANATQDQTASEIKTLLQSDKLTANEIATGALDGRYYTEAESDARYFNISTGDTIKDGDTFPDNDTTIATTAAINDRIIDLVDEVGGFVPIANETSFPTANPDAENGTGTIVSVKAASTNLTPSGTTVTIANGAGTGNTVTITGVPSVIPSGFGFLVETTTTLHTYTFHRLTPNATQVSTVAGKATQIQTVHDNITQVQTVHNNIIDIQAVAADASDIGAVAAKATEIGLLGTSAVITDMGLLGNSSVIADMDLLGTSDVIADMNLLATSDVIADMALLAVADVISDMNDLATSANITAMANCSNSISSINNASSNLNSINNFGDKYQVAANNPSTDGGGNALAVGDLYFNTSANELKVYNGSSWQAGVTATGNFALTTGNTFTGDNRYNDNVKALFGTGQDLHIYHSGTNSYIQDNGTGALYIGSNNTSGAGVLIRGKHGEESIIANSNGSVQLYYDNAKKFETTSGGATVFGNLELSSTYPSLVLTDTNHNSDYRITNNDGQFIIYDSTNAAHRLNINADGNIQIPADNKILYIGAGSDLKLYHDGNHSFVSNSGGAGNLVLYGNGTNSIVAQAVAGENSFIGNSNGSVELYYDHSKKLETTSTGVALTGNLELGDNERIVLGDAGTSDSHIRWDASHLQIASAGQARFSCSGLSVVNLAGTETQLTTTENGAVELYHDNNKTAFTSLDAWNVYGRSANSGMVEIASNQGANNNDRFRIHKTSASSTLSIQNYTSGSWETNIACNGNGNVELYYDNSKKLQTTTTGVYFWGNIDAGDNNKILLGAGDDLEIYHDGSNSYLENNTGTLYILPKSNQNGIQLVPDGAVRLYYGGSLKVETISTGIQMNGDIKIEDNHRIKIGAGEDLQLYHDGSNSYINHTNSSGDPLYIQSENDIRIRVANTEEGVKVKSNGAIELYYDNVKKFETTSEGTTLRGTVHRVETLLRPLNSTNTDLGTTGDRWRDVYVYNSIDLLDNGKLKIGTSDDIQIYHNGTNSIIQNTTGVLAIQSGNLQLQDQANNHPFLTAVGDGAVSLYYDNSKKFETGATHSYVYSANNGNHGGLIIRNTNSSNGSRAELRLEAQNNASFATIFCDHVNQNLRLGYNSTGTTIDIFGNGDMYTGNVIPNANNSKDLGTSSFRWANVYTNDLNLSNEGGKNDVDGTWGSYTIQEGAEDLFLINKRNGKKYKFNLTEVS